MLELLQGRAARLTPWMEIMESAAMLDEPVSTEVLVELAVQAAEALGDGPEEAQALSDDERREILILAALMKGIQEILHLMAERRRPGRQRRLLQEQAESLGQDILLPRLQQLSAEQRASLFAESAHWAYLVLQPAQQLMLLEILGRTSTGARPLAAQREWARTWYDHLSAWWPAGKRLAKGDD